ncbi:hypothetical protein IIV6-T1_346 [Invertebrate iridescent virus 6]|nr:hypothetical protein IIV6-T1_346 [Invertebrate iridescent virus 6]
MSEALKLIRSDLKTLTPDLPARLHEY